MAKLNEILTNGRISPSFKTRFYFRNESESHKIWTKTSVNPNHTISEDSDFRISPLTVRLKTLSTQHQKSKSKKQIRPTTSPSSQDSTLKISGRSRYRASRKVYRKFQNTEKFYSNLSNVALRSYKRQRSNLPKILKFSFYLEKQIQKSKIWKILTTGIIIYQTQNVHKVVKMTVFWR